VEAAVADVAGLEASSVEIEAGGMSYTADTLRTLLDGDPARSLFVILGSDAAAGVTTWERAEEVRDMATIVVVERPGTPPAQPLEGWRWVSVEVPSLEVSSTDLRARVADGRPLDYLVTHEVVDCIEARGLYRDPVR
jgi:nicotinate-nucleotide adenylyltransferase